MRPTRESDRDIFPLDRHCGFSSHEVAIDLRRITVLESTQFLGEHAVQGIGDSSHDDVEVYFGQNRRRQRVEVKELNRLRDAVFNPPAPGVVANNRFRRGAIVIADDKGRLFVSIAPMLSENQNWRYRSPVAN